MLRAVQRFGKHFSCHLRGEYVLVGGLWQLYVGYAMGSERTHRLPYIRLPKTTNQYESSLENLRARVKNYSLINGEKFLDDILSYFTGGTLLHGDG
jgi:hypothetical protein